ncbi:hypothetical protein BT93_L2437 [Corymbia citriodora subsp. variegata]|uniref:Uncharacterized protein n=1 Tax=Corymbia citriodora subsp. variegata TaxID=360336 RepID=A0A8T0CMB3_CORYI|nr:hypothetical protein BT93_L2437 [Corymbia citriodora subsp. variegata]
MISNLVVGAVFVMHSCPLLEKTDSRLIHSCKFPVYTSLRHTHVLIAARSFAFPQFVDHFLYNDLISCSKPVEGSFFFFKRLCFLNHMLGGNYSSNRSSLSS